MSDHDDDNDHICGPECEPVLMGVVIGPNGPVRADSEEGRRIIESGQMQMESVNARRRTFFRTIAGNEDALDVMTELFQDIMTDQKPRTRAAYFLGVIHSMEAITVSWPKEDEAVEAVLREMVSTQEEDKPQREVSFAVVTAEVKGGIITSSEGGISMCNDCMKEIGETHEPTCTRTDLDTATGKFTELKNGE